MTPEEQALSKELGLLLIRDSFRPIAGSIFYGISLGLFGYAAYLFQTQRVRGRLIWVTLVTGLACFLLTSINFGVIVATIAIEIEALIGHSARLSATTPGGYFNPQEYSHLHSAYLTYFLTQNLILGVSDVIVIWRTRVLYPDQPRIFWFPVICLVASAGCLGTGLWQQRGLPGWPTTHIISAGRAVDDVGHALSLLANAFTTFYVAVRLWSSQNWVLKYLYPSENICAPLQKKLLVLVETGALFCFVQMMALGSIIAIDVKIATGKTCSSSCFLTHWLISRFRFAFAANYSILVIILVYSKKSLAYHASSFSVGRFSTVQAEAELTEREGSP